MLLVLPFQGSLILSLTETGFMPFYGYVPVPLALLTQDTPGRDPRGPLPLPLSLKQKAPKAFLSVLGSG